MKKIEASSRFERNLKFLKKRYRHISKDVAQLISELKAGELPGDKIPGSDYNIYKVRIRNSDLDKGKSGGYRVIYYVHTQEAV